MIEVLEFIFSGFFVWLGTLMMLGVIFPPLGYMFSRSVNHYYGEDKDDDDKD